jgi:hypothetical protein
MLMDTPCRSGVPFGPILRVVAVAAALEPAFDDDDPLLEHAASGTASPMQAI